MRSRKRIAQGFFKAQPELSIGLFVWEISEDKSKTVNLVIAVTSVFICVFNCVKTCVRTHILGGP